MIATESWWTRDTNFKLFLSEILGRVTKIHNYSLNRFEITFLKKLKQAPYEKWKKLLLSFKLNNALYLF